MKLNGRKFEKEADYARDSKAAAEAYSKAQVEMSRATSEKQQATSEAQLALQQEILETVHGKPLPRSAPQQRNFQRNRC